MYTCILTYWLACMLSPSYLAVYLVPPGWQPVVRTSGGSGEAATCSLHRQQRPVVAWSRSDGPVTPWACCIRSGFRQGSSRTPGAAHWMLLGIILTYACLFLVYRIVVLVMLSLTLLHEHVAGTVCWVHVVARVSFCALVHGLAVVTYT